MPSAFPAAVYMGFGLFRKPLSFKLMKNCAVARIGNVRAGHNSAAIVGQPVG